MYKIITAMHPGFPMGGADLYGVLTSDAGTFQRKCMQRQKNWVLLGAGMHQQCPPGSTTELFEMTAVTVVQLVLRKLD